LIEERKQAVSMRLSAGDIHRIKGLAHRLGVRGRSPVPPPAARGPEVVREFGFDATTLQEIVNGDASGAIRRASAQGGYRAWRCACRGSCEAQGHELA